MKTNDTLTDLRIPRAIENIGVSETLLRTQRPREADLDGILIRALPNQNTPYSRG